MLKLIGSGLSPFARKVRVALIEKGLDYEHDPVIPQMNPPAGFEKISPLGKIPVLQDGDFAVPDSSVILSYLEHRYPDPPLLPIAPGPRARVLWFEEYGDSKVSLTLAGVFFERVVKPAIFKQETNQAVIDQALKQELPKIFDYLTQCLGEDEFMVGGAFSIADIALTSSFVNFAIAGERLDTERWPRIAAYVERVHSIPCYAPIVAGDHPGR